jgi:hypothetical protein
MKRYDAAMGCSLALLIMATAVTSFLYPIWVFWNEAAAKFHDPDGTHYLMYMLMALPALLLSVLWALFLWVARRPQPPAAPPPT